MLSCCDYRIHHASLKSTKLKSKERRADDEELEMKDLLVSRCWRRNT